MLPISDAVCVPCRQGQSLLALGRVECSLPDQAVKLVRVAVPLPAVRIDLVEGEDDQLVLVLRRGGGNNIGLLRRGQDVEVVDLSPKVDGTCHCLGRPASLKVCLDAGQRS